jgi:hypothetical protein
MASYALLLALSGYRYDAIQGALAFAPRIHEQEFACFFTTATGWGLFRQAPGRARIEVRGGEIRLDSLSAPTIAAGAAVTLDGRPLDATVTAGVACFAVPAVAAAGQTLEVG